HAQARNIVEHIFGVLKKRWDILNRAPQFDMLVQAKIPPGLGAVHNFIIDHDDHDLEHYLNALDIDEPFFTGEPGAGAIPRVERERADALQAEIATSMWNAYQ
ncbi:hypothetical protein CPB83DRAFT_748575, partial [Crepidotus variabilis]